MSTKTSQITGVPIVCSTVASGADQRKHQSSASLTFVRGIHRWPIAHGCGKLCFIAVYYRSKWINMVYLPIFIRDASLGHPLDYLGSREINLRNMDEMGHYTNTTKYTRRPVQDGVVLRCLKCIFVVENRRILINSSQIFIHMDEH